MSQPGKEEAIPLMEIASTSGASEGKDLSVLRVDVHKRSRSSSSTRSPVDYRYSQVSPKSPQLSADRLSVKFAPGVFNFQEADMEKVRFNKENTVTDGEDDEEEAVAGEEEEEEEDEDYSASVSAILLRRASSRRQTKRRRPSSTFSPEGLDLVLPRRRSSVVTTTSAETAISIEEGVTEEHIFHNIRLHKEVLSSVKQQPWPMRKKIKLVKQAKKYVKRHEGELQERLAQSKTTKDMLACCDIIFVKEWQFAKRELANFMNVMVPWELRIKEIESHFGSVVASYFTFLRWLFWVNLMISLILLTFVAIPEIFLADQKNSGERKQVLPDEAANSTKLITLWDFEGVLKYSPLFYGFYNSQENLKRGYGYKGPLAYFITGIAVYIYSFVATLRRMAENSRQSKLSEKDDECVFTWKLFTGWDYMIGNSETAHNRTASIILGFKEALLEEAEKKRNERSWKMLALRALINLCVLGLFAFSVFAVVSVVRRSASPQNEGRRGWWKQNEVTIIVSLITNVFPFLFEILGSMERYHPRKRLRMQLGRIMVLNLLNLYTFIFASFSKINDKTVQLQKIKESLMNMTMAASMALKSENVTPTIASIANTMMDDVTRGSNSTPRQMNCTKVIRCSTMTSQSTSDLPRTSISSLATLLLLTSSSISTPPTISEKNSTLVLPFNNSKTLEDFPYLNSDSTNRSNDLNQRANNHSLEDYDNQFWKLLLPNSVKSQSESDLKLTKEKNSSNKFNNGEDESRENKNPSFSVTNKSFPPALESNWLIDKIKINVKSQYNVTDIDENNLTRPFDYDILNQIDYDDFINNTDCNRTDILKNETFGDYDIVDESFTTSSYQDFENYSGSSTSTDDGCYYITVCTEWMPNVVSTTPDSPAEVFINENVDQKSLTTLSTTKTTELPSNVDLSLQTYRLNITMRRVLRNLCWETVFGQELVKLTVMDLVLTIISTLMVDFIRALFVRVMNNCWCWDLEKKFPQYGDFKIAENILHLVNNQGMVWMGMFFSPGLPLINLIKLAIMMYLRSWAVLTCNVPHEVVFRASRSNNFYLALLLTMLFLCVLPVSYAIVWVEPSWHCGPFSNYPKIYYLFTNSTKNALPKELHHTLDYIASPGIVIPLLMLLILIIYYLISLTNSLREANNDLKVQLRRERTEERRKVFQMVDRKHRGDFSGDLIDNTPFHKWQKTLTILPNKTSTDSPSEPVPVKSNATNAVNGDLKSDAKKLISKLSKHAKHKSSGKQDEESLLIDANGTDFEPAESLPDDVSDHAMKSKHSVEQSEVVVGVPSRESSMKKKDEKKQPSHHHHHHHELKEVEKEKREKFVVLDDSPTKDSKRIKDSTKSQRRKGSDSSASSEDSPEIVISHKVGSDSLHGHRKQLEQSKSSSIDTVIESGEFHKRQDKKKTDKMKSSKSDKLEKTSPLHKPQKDDAVVKKYEHRTHQEIKEGKRYEDRSEEKVTKKKHVPDSDVDDREQKKSQHKKHSSKESYDLEGRERGDDSKGKETRQVKHRDTDSDQLHRKTKIHGSKTSSKLEKQIDHSHTETRSSGMDCHGPGSITKFKDKRHFDRVSGEKDHSTESSSIDRSEKNQRRKSPKYSKDEVSYASSPKYPKSNQSKEIKESDYHHRENNLNDDDYPLEDTSARKAHERRDSQKSGHQSRKFHKTADYDGDEKISQPKSDKTESYRKHRIKENNIKESESEQIDRYTNEKSKDSKREIISSTGDSFMENKKYKSHDIKEKSHKKYKDHMTESDENSVVRHETKFTSKQEKTQGNSKREQVVREDLDDNIERKIKKRKETDKLSGSEHSISSQKSALVSDCTNKSDSSESRKRKNKKENDNKDPPIIESSKDFEDHPRIKQSREKDSDFRKKAKEKFEKDTDVRESKSSMRRKVDSENGDYVLKREDTEDNSETIHASDHGQAKFNNSSSLKALQNKSNIKKKRTISPKIESTADTDSCVSGSDSSENGEMRSILEEEYHPTTNTDRENYQSDQDQMSDEKGDDGQLTEKADNSSEDGENDHCYSDEES